MLFSISGATSHKCIKSISGIQQNQEAKNKELQKKRLLASIS
jgi:hypothetical protein